jgi:hypothetical protein
MKLQDLSWGSHAMIVAMVGSEIMDSLREAWSSAVWFEEDWSEYD